MLLQDQAKTRKESVLDDSQGQSCIILCGVLIVLRFTFLKIVKLEIFFFFKPSFEIFFKHRT